MQVATQLWDRVYVPHRTAVEKPARVKEREAILQQQRNKRYQLLMDSDEEEDTIKKRRILLVVILKVCGIFLFLI